MAIFSKDAISIFMHVKIRSAHPELTYIQSRKALAVEGVYERPDSL